MNLSLPEFQSQNEPEVRLESTIKMSELKYEIINILLIFENWKNKGNNFRAVYIQFITIKISKICNVTIGIC